jgi:hypothetical protein
MEGGIMTDIRMSSMAGIPFGNNASRPTNANVGQPYFNGESQRLELYTGAQYGWQNIVAETPGVTGYNGTVLQTNTTNTITIGGTNFALGASASLIGQDGTEIVSTSTTVNNLTSATAVFGAIDATKEPYDIKMTNPSNLYGIYYDILTVNDAPIWFTAAGSLGTFVSAQAVSVSVNATDEENNSITYSSSNLPAWLSLNSSSGLLTGTAPTSSTNQTYSFAINASDSSNTQVSRSFTITVNAVSVITGGTLTSDSTYYYRTFINDGNLVVSNISATADVLLVAGGGGGGSGWYAGGGGAGGVKLYSSLSLSTQSHSVVIGQGGTGTTDARNTSNNGQNSTFSGSYFATGGGGGGSRNQRTSGSRVGGNGGSGGGAAFPGTLGGLGTSGEGNNGGSNDGGGYGASGGGAGAAGNPGISTPFGTNGGAGTNAYSAWLTAISPAMTGVSGWSTATSGGFIGGGGAAGSDDSILRLGGSGGGGNGAQGGANGATNGIANTGGGGGGGSGTESDSTPSSPQRGATGGSGLVIVRYTRASVGG